MIGGIAPSNPLSIAARGIADANTRMTDAARRSVAGPDIDAAVETRTARADVEASVAVAKTADEMTGTLIDTLA